MSIFRFKQFGIDQSGCTMKVNTDGVLLGGMALANRPSRILDVGTGTGVIALMLAQRFTSATLDAIEIDSMAADTARSNFEISPFSGRLSCHAVSLHEYKAKGPYDLVVSNPPYFLQSLKNNDKRKQLARHTDISFFDCLLERSAAWLAPSGSLQLILPLALADRIGQQATSDYGMTVQWERDIRSFALHPPIRKILAIGKSPTEESAIPDDFVIYESKGVYSQGYRELLKDFFLAF